MHDATVSVANQSCSDIQYAYMIVSAILLLFHSDVNKKIISFKKHFRDNVAKCFVYFCTGSGNRFQRNHVHGWLDG